MLFNFKRKSCLIYIPDPPSLEIIPKNKTAIVTSVVGELGKALYSISEKWIKGYSKRLNSDLIVLDWEGPKNNNKPIFPIFGKFQFRKVLDIYDRAIFIDADTWANSNKCPNLFDIVPEDSIGLYDDLIRLKELGSNDRFCIEYMNIRNCQDLSKELPKYYGNTGIIVASKEHSNLFKRPLKPIKLYHCSEQHHWISQFHENNAKIFFLDTKCNYQYWANNRFSNKIPSDAIIHFSGMHEKSIKDRIDFMKKTIEDFNAS